MKNVCDRMNRQGNNYFDWYAFGLIRLEAVHYDA